jgi:hypothetical protein
MDEAASNSPGERESREPEANNGAQNPAAKAAPASGEPAASESMAADSKLPVVWSPNLGGAAEHEPSEEFPPFDADEAIAASAFEATGEEMNAAAAPAEEKPLPRSLRFAMLAASVAAAAALGSFVGALSATGIAQLWPASHASVAAANAPQSARADAADFGVLKANLDNATRNAGNQFAKLADRLDHLERAQIEPSLKLARIADALERLEKKSGVASAAAPETTGSIAGGSPAAEAEAKQSEILPDWVVQDVRGGRALVENRFGAIFDVSTGSVLPGLGRIESIKRQDGQWVVVTARGSIVGH